MAFLTRLDYRYLRTVSVPLAILALALLAFVVMPLPGALKKLVVASYGSSRWIQLGPLPEVQPGPRSPNWPWWCTSRTGWHRKDWAFAASSEARFLSGSFSCRFWYLWFASRTWGRAAVIVLLAFALFFVSGARLIHVALAVLMGIAGAAAMILLVGDYPMQRIQILLNPWADPQGNGYQTVHGLEALGAGGLFGTGLGNTLVFVPSDVNDFIFSVIAQQLGLVAGRS